MAKILQFETGQASATDPKAETILLSPEQLVLVAQILKQTADAATQLEGLLSQLDGTAASALIAEANSDE